MNAVVVQSEQAQTMFTMTLNEIKQAINAKIIGVDSSAPDSSMNDFIVRGINTDSRTIKQGELFVALKGDNFDAHDFISHASNRGAAAYILDREIEGVKPALIVTDTRIALGQLANAWRKKFNYPIVAVTGSNGKTTVKEMLHSILATQGNVLATRGNFNNDIGVPLTLYRLTTEHASAVIEMGANHQLEISYLTNLVKPDIAIITNAAAAHLEGFGSLDGVAKAKGEIFEGLNDSGVAIINRDDDRYTFWKKLIGNKKIISFGVNDKANVSYIKNKAVMTVRINGSDKFDLKLPLLGKHNEVNALAAIAASVALNIDFSSIQHALESMKPIAGRLENKQGINDSHIIDDTYNANPASLTAAVEAMKNFTGEQFAGSYHVVLGDMGELGDDTIRLHEDVAEVLHQAKISFLYTLGESSVHTNKRFTKLAKDASPQHFATHDELVEQLQKNIKHADVVLVKGSRSMQMEKIVNAICIESKKAKEQ